MFYFVYETRNIINNKIYIGVHSTYNLNDGYIGSGNTLKKAIRKYGYSAFERTILFFTRNIEEAFWIETNIVTNDFIRRKDVYNEKIGGLGGNTSNTLGYINGMKLRRSYKGDKNPAYGKGGMKDKNHSQKTKEKQSNARKLYWNNMNDNDRMTRGDSIKGSKNGMFGRLPSNAIAVCFDGKQYTSLAEASRQTGHSVNFIKKYIERNK